MHRMPAPRQPIGHAYRAGIRTFCLIPVRWPGPRHNRLDAGVGGHLGFALLGWAQVIL